MSRVKWLLFAAVCAGHFSLIAAFSKDGRSGKVTSSPKLTFSFRMTNAQPEMVEHTKATAIRSKIEPLKSSKSDVIAATSAESDQGQDSISTVVAGSAADSLHLFNHDRFLDAIDLDKSAVAGNGFEDALGKSLPSQFDSVVLELLIDDNGQPVQVMCIEGDCSTELSDKLQLLLAIPFVPAIKNGQAVASRKLIQVLPTPTFGL